MSAAIASATAAAAAAVASKDVTDPASYPACAQACIAQTLPASGCGSLANRRRVCQESNFNTNTGSCEVKTCSASDLQIIKDLAYKLCDSGSTGGIGNASTSVNQTIGTQTAPPAPAFTGGATLLATKGMVVCLGLVVAIVLVAL